MAGIGASAAAGIESGFNMGMRADEFAERKRATAASEARTAALDTERTARQAKADLEHEDDRALAAAGQEMQDHALYGAGLAAQYGGPDKIPGAEGRAYADKAAEIGTRRAALLRKRYEPQVKAEQQWAQDTASRIQTGQMNMDDLSPADTVRLIQATSRRPLADFIAPKNGKSRVKQAIDDTTAGLETKNQGLMLQGAGNLMAPELQTGLGHVASDGSVITKKDLYALVPAPQRGPSIRPSPITGLAAALDAATAPSVNGKPQPAPLQPGSDPDLVMPVLQVTAQHPDGTEVQYPAPVTEGRGAGADDKVAQPLSIKGAMDRMGQLSALEAWANTPKAREKLEQGLKDLGQNSNSFLGAYYAMHGDAKALLPPGSEDPTSKKIAAIKKLAADQGVSFAEASAAFAGKGTGVAAGGGTLAQTFKTIDADPTLSDADKAAAKRAKVLGVKQAAETPAAAGVGVSSAASAATPTATTGLGQANNKVNPAAQAAADSDALKILRDERAKTVQKVAAGTASQNDVDAIDREIAKTGKSAAAGAAPASPALGGAPAPGGVGEKAVDFWARAVIAGDRDWQVGLGRSKTGSQLIEQVKRRVPEMAAELGLSPADIGTTRAQQAALGATLKDLTKRSEAVELFASKVDKDMKTFDALLDKAAPNGPMFINKPLNALRRQFNDADLAQLDLAAKQVGAEYERLITGGTLSVAQLHAGASEDAKKLINGDMTPQVARATMKTMQQEMQNARTSAHESRDRVSDQMRSLGGSRGGVGAAAPAGGTGVGGGGAPKAPPVGTVMQGFRFKGGDPAQQSNWEKQ